MSWACDNYMSQACDDLNSTSFVVGWHIRVINGWNERYIYVSNVDCEDYK